MNGIERDGLRHAYLQDDNDDDDDEVFFAREGFRVVRASAIYNDGSARRLSCFFSLSV